MAARIDSQPQLQQSHADMTTRIGAWLFRRRTVVPIPLAVALLMIPASPAQPSALVATGAVLVALGEAIRLWGVRHIGAISRTRSDRLGRLVASGPFALVRNPLYLGNVVLWGGFAVSARVPWLIPAFVAILALEYHAIVRWEERLLEERLGERYRAYAARVPRWLPNTVDYRDSKARGDQNVSADSAISGVSVFSWRETFYSERGTLIAIAVGYLLLWIKSQL
jgi:protein-S-isoprenylcysteine O-methyltransferase Ste14